MGEQELKDIEIIFDKEMPQKIGTEIKITAVAGNNDKLEYKFIVGKNCHWKAIQDYSKDNTCIWKPDEDAVYTIMVQARGINKKISLDHLAKEKYSIIKGEVMSFMNNDKSDNNEVIKKEDSKDKFKEYISNGDMNLLEAAKITKDEKEELIKNLGVIDLERAKKEVAVTTEFGEEELAMKIKNKNIKVQPKDEEKKKFEGDIITKGKADDKKEESVVTKLQTKEVYEYNLQPKTDVINNDISNNSCEIIKDVEVNKEKFLIGEKAILTVTTFENKDYLYRFYEKKFNEWMLIKDYDKNNVLNYTANECGKKEILVQCKNINSTENFDDFTTVEINVSELGKVEIKNIKCINDEIVVSDELKFEVQCNISPENNDSVVLYKFYKISKNGKSTCIQDYSTNNQVFYIEETSGEYRLLCLAKTMLSNKEFDDRAILIYKVKPYKDVKIDSFVASLNSPQASETEITFTSDTKGGNNLLYRYRVNGPIEEDTGYCTLKEFTWKPTEPGEYEILLYVKDETFNGDFEDTSKVAFTIEKRGKKPIKILDVVVDKDKKVVINKNVNLLVKAEGATSLLYSFIINKDNKILKTIPYSITNWFDYVPTEVGDYEIEILIKDKYSIKEFDTHTFVNLKVQEYLPGEIDYVLMPYNSRYIVGDVIELECILENTENVLVKYETKINGQKIEETDFCKNKKLRFSPKSPGKYTIEIYAKNILCNKDYDSKKQINIYVEESSPIIDTKIISSGLEGKVNEEFSIEVQSRGGKDVCYEFYLMQNNNWTKVQSYSKKNFYSFIPFVAGNYRILAFAKSYYKKVNYEDYADFTFCVKE